MADQNSQASQDAAKPAAAMPGKPEAEETPRDERQAEAAMMGLRLGAEEQAAELGDLGLRLAREVSSRMTEGILRINELNRDLAVMQVDTLRRLSACRSPQEVLEVQQDYWRSVMGSTLEGGLRLAELPLGLPAAWSEAAEPVVQHSIRHMDRAMRAG